MRRTSSQALVLLILGLAITLGSAISAEQSRPPARQTPRKTPKFEIADVHVSAKGNNPNLRTTCLGGRSEWTNATMVDLISASYGIESEKVVGGPSWLGTDRFDVIAKHPADVAAETRKAMLQTLLADRFNLIVHQATRPQAALALIVVGKPLLKQTGGSGQSGCRQLSPAPPVDGRVTVGLACRNVSMAVLVGTLRGLLGTASLESKPIVDQTGLKGPFSFDINWSVETAQTPDRKADKIALLNAVQRQLGLKLEERRIPTSVIVVDSVNRQPAANPPGASAALATAPPPARFEVASVKRTEPSNMDAGEQIRRGLKVYQVRPEGRLTARGMTMRFLVFQAFNTLYSDKNDQIAGLPSWAETDQFDIIAKAPSQGPAARPLDAETVAPMLRALLADRFQMKYHTEARPVSVYSLVSAKPKLKAGNPASRSFCKDATAGVSRILSCENTTMLQLAERLQGLTQELSRPVSDATGIKGGWNFTLTFSRIGRIAGSRATDEAQMGLASAADPNGSFTIFEAVEKQLGLKLVMQKRPVPIVVIDRIERRPTDN